MTLDARAEAERLSLISQTLRSEGDVSARPGQMASLHALADRVDLIAARLAATQTRTVTTVEALWALGPRTIVLAGDDDVWRCTRPGSWDCLSEDGTGGMRGPEAIYLPATVLYVPTDEVVPGE